MREAFIRSPKIAYILILIGVIGVLYKPGVLVGVPCLFIGLFLLFKGKSK